MDGSMCILLFELAYFLQCSSFICLSWTFERNTLILKCQTSHMEDTISFYDPYNQEQGHCAIPFPFTECIVYNQHWRITQNITLKETLLEISGESTDKMDGQWECHLGRKLESAVTNVKISNSFIHNRKCKLGECWCGEDGNTFHVKHEGFQKGGIVTIQCKVAFEQQVIMSGCRLNNIVNIESPEIKHDKELPFVVTENISLSCFGSFSGARVHLRWDCLDIQPNIYVSNSTFIKAILTFQVTFQMNNLVCRCIAFYRNLEASSSFQMTVRKAPILQVDRSFICKQYDAIEIACSAIGGMSIVDFGLWTHLHGGYFIRYLQGFKDGNTSAIKLTNCSYEDEGEYVCSAWSSDHGVSVWNNISSNVIIQGTPLVTAKHVFKESMLIFVVKIYAVPSIIQLYWFSGNEIIVNSTQYTQTIAKTVIHRKVHGQVIAAKGYSANLTVYNYSKAAVPVNLFLVVENADGNVTTNFFLGKKESFPFPADSFKDYKWPYIMIGIIIFGISVALLMLLAKRQGRRGNGVFPIYYAAPPNDLNMTTYDLSDPISTNEEGATVNSEETSLNQQDKPEHRETFAIEDTEYEYEMPHDYIEVL